MPEMVVLADTRVRLVGGVEELLATHHRLTGPRRDPVRIPQDQHVISARHTDRQSTFIIRTDSSIQDPGWSVSSLSLEDLVLAYLSPADVSDAAPALEVLR
jgi:ABC-2 type transport system ATP-binding protein